MSNIAWSRRDAGFGMALAAVPMVAIAAGQVTNGLRFLVGALPAAIIGLLPRRRARWQLIVIGALFGASMMLGSLIAQWWGSPSWSCSWPDSGQPCWRPADH